MQILIFLKTSHFLQIDWALTMTSLAAEMTSSSCLCNSADFASWYGSDAMTIPLQIQIIYSQQIDCKASHPNEDGQKHIIGSGKSSNARFEGTGGLLLAGVRDLQAVSMLQALTPVPRIHRAVCEHVHAQPVPLVVAKLPRVAASIRVGLFSISLRLACLPLAFIVRRVRKSHRTDAIALPARKLASVLQPPSSVAVCPEADADTMRQI
jgi:hypothetical protein